jgi:hypothetical protein
MRLAAVWCLYRDGEFSAHPLWHASWVEVQPIRQAVLDVALRIGGGLLLELGEGVGGTGNTQAVLQFTTWELQVIMQVVVVKVRGVESPGMGVTTFGVVVCASAAPLVVVATIARMIAKVLMVASSSSARWIVIATFWRCLKQALLASSRDHGDGKRREGKFALATSAAPSSAAVCCIVAGCAAGA